MPNYYVWTKHGEREITLDNNEEEEDRIPDFAANYDSFFNDTAMGESEEDTEGYVVEDDLSQMLRETEEGCETEKESKYLKRMLEDYRTLLACLQTRPKEVGYHIGIIAMEGIKWFV